MGGEGEMGGFLVRFSFACFEISCKHNQLGGSDWANQWWVWLWMTVALGRLHGKHQMGGSLWTARMLLSLATVHVNPTRKAHLVLSVFTGSFWKSFWGFCTWQEFPLSRRWGIWGWNWTVHEGWERIPGSSCALWVNICLLSPLKAVLSQADLWAPAVSCKVFGGSLIFVYNLFSTLFPTLKF